MRFADRVAGDPDNAGKKKRQKQAEQRSGKRNDDFVERGNFRQLRAIQIGLAFDDVHRRELGQRDEPAKGKRTERVLDAIDRFFPERFAKPDAEFFYVKPARARGQKMPELVDDDEQIEEDEYLEQDQDDTRDVEKHQKGE